jgi:hypothetical protein
MEKASKVLRWVSFGFEAFWAIPFLAGFIISTLAWTPLLFMLILHVVTLVFCIKSNTKYYGSIVGVIASILGFIPFVGWALHFASAIALLVSSIGSGSKQQQNININLSNIGNNNHKD